MPPQNAAPQNTEGNQPDEQRSNIQQEQAAQTVIGTPIAEATFPANAAIGNDKKPAEQITRRKLLSPKNAIVAIGILILCATNFGSYLFGYHHGHTASSSTIASAEAADSDLQVPKGATIISQCAVGRGTQYVLPSNIPHGPVFNEYHGKVIGIEYMISKDDLAGDNSFYNLPMYGKIYDHLNIGLLSKGHAGYPVPHYHVDLYTVSQAESNAITCK